MIDEETILEETLKRATEEIKTTRRFPMLLPKKIPKVIADRNLRKMIR